MTFTCKDCGSHKLEEIQSGVQVCSEISINDGYVVYGEQTNEDGEIDRFQCTNCGESLKDEKGELLTDTDDLIVYLEEQPEIQRRDEKNGLYPDKIDDAN